jgi:hypothetical protein
MNIGPPITEVMTPTGRPVAVRTLAMQSQIIRNAAPKQADAGIR